MRHRGYAYETSECVSRFFCACKPELSLSRSWPRLPPACGNGGHLRSSLSLLWSQDFAYYKSGVYKHMHGENVGGHAVKLIGWGTTEEGVDYWVGGAAAIRYSLHLSPSLHQNSLTVVSIRFLLTCACSCPHSPHISQ